MFNIVGFHIPQVCCQQKFFSAERFWNAGGLHKSVVIQRYSESMCWKQELFFPAKYQKIFLTMHKNHHNLTFFTTKEKNYIKLMLKCHFSNISSERLVSALAIIAAHVSIYYRRVCSSSSGQFAAVYTEQMPKRYYDCPSKCWKVNAVSKNL